MENLLERGCSIGDNGSAMSSGGLELLTIKT
jgi:hypothetical protein